MLFGFIVLSGGCWLKQRGVVYGGPISHVSGNASETAVGEETIGNRMVRALKKVIGHIGPQDTGAWQQCCCGHISDKCEELKNFYKEQLFCSLDEHMTALTEQEKEDMSSLIVKFPCVSITELKKAGIQPREVLEGLSVELGINEKKIRGVVMEENAQDGLGECAICLEDLKSDLIVLPCHPTHAFHDNCIKEWVAMQVSPPSGSFWLCKKIFYLFNKASCPICRAGFSPFRMR